MAGLAIGSASPCATAIRIKALNLGNSQPSADFPDELRSWLGETPLIIHCSNSEQHSLLSACSSSGDRIGIGWWSARFPELTGLDRLLTTYLLGNLVGTALRLQGQIVLHGNAARIGDRTIVWVGDKGAGKSTLSGAFLDAGYELITDDQVVLYPEAAYWHPGYGVPRIRLWPESLGHFSMTTREVYSQPFGKTVKGWLEAQVPDRAALTGPPVATICVLEPRQAGMTEARITPLSPGRQLQILHRHRLARLSLPLSPERQQAEFASLARLASAVPVYSVQLPDDLRLLPKAVKQLATRFSGPIAA
jgi:hypothetical protein